MARRAIIVLFAISLSSSSQLSSIFSFSSEPSDIFLEDDFLGSCFLWGVVCLGRRDDRLVEIGESVALEGDSVVVRLRGGRGAGLFVCDLLDRPVLWKGKKIITKEFVLYLVFNLKYLITSDLTRGSH